TSERLDSAEAVALANRALSAMARHIVEQDGYVNKFLGDGLMAFWSAFEVQPDQAARACVAAAACAKAIHDLPDTDLGVRLGIATGEAIVGDCGAPPELNDYTAIGDTVNTASRIEGANKAFSTHVLIDDETKRQAGDAIRTLPIGPVIVVGRSTPTMLHALVDHSCTDEAITAATALQSAVSAGDRGAAAAALERMGEFKELDPLCMHWAETIDGDGALVLTLYSK
ncbi:MAG: adenylate/guanylate cyclase domain-containing protein, partial [Phycisphaerales bacterium]|nr:adenylate/guanylate cyclase domain-containing protein [Phycisphaerales bacterium]